MDRELEMALAIKRAEKAEAVVADMVQLLGRVSKALPAGHKYRDQVTAYLNRKALASPLRIEGCAVISINDDKREWSGDMISHEQICEIAGQPIWASVTYSTAKKGDAMRMGCTCEGESIAVEDGLRIDCIVTGAA